MSDLRNILKEEYKKKEVRDDEGGARNAGRSEDWRRSSQDSEQSCRRRINNLTT